jgi:hypothetical protein
MAAAPCLSNRGLQAGPARLWNRRRRSGPIRHRHKSWNQVSTAARGTQRPSAQAVQMSARRDRSGRDSTNRYDRTQRGLPSRRATIRVGRLIPLRYLQPSVVRLCSQRRRVWRATAWCHSTACWDDPTSATSASGRPATNEAQRRNHVLQPAPVRRRGRVGGDRQRRSC